jgi:hypothetical protein
VEEKKKKKLEPKLVWCAVWDREAFFFDVTVPAESLEKNAITYVIG